MGDNFEKLANIKSRHLDSIYDYLKSPSSQVMPLSGKPNVIVNSKNIRGGRYISQTLSKFSVNEVIELASLFSAGA
jgi:hypothetical protein